MSINDYELTGEIYCAYASAFMSKVLKNYLRHEAAIKRYLFRFFSRQQDVDDVAQEAFIKAYATEIRTDVRHPRRLLFRAAKHAALSELSRKVNVTTDYIEDMEETAVLVDKREAAADEALNTRRMLAALSMAIAELPPMCQKVFILRKVEALPAKEVAARLQISVSAVEKHGALGIVKCGRRLKELGYDPQDFGTSDARLEKRKTNPSRKVAKVKFDDK